MSSLLDKGLGLLKKGNEKPQTPRHRNMWHIRNVDLACLACLASALKPKYRRFDHIRLIVFLCEDN
ncbi:hypothetical protein C0J52_13592 [Blattella germanica]|nr:hypothetical protein C0J52_13592 [Blattella germanica]